MFCLALTQAGLSSPNVSLPRAPLCNLVLPFPSGKDHEEGGAAPRMRRVQVQITADHQAVQDLLVGRGQEAQGELARHAGPDVNSPIEHFVSFF